MKYNREDILEAYNLGIKLSSCKDEAEWRITNIISNSRGVPEEGLVSTLAFFKKMDPYIETLKNAKKFVDFDSIKEDRDDLKDSVRKLYREIRSAEESLKKL